MIQFLYLSDYSDNSNIGESGGTDSTGNNHQDDADTEGFAPGDLGPLLLHARVYAVAEQYDMPDLKTLAKEKYEESVGRNWNSASFVASLKIIYETTPESDRDLKGVALAVAGQNVEALCDRPEFVELCTEYAEITYDILKVSFSPKSVLKCPACSSTGSAISKNQVYNKWSGGYHAHHCNSRDHNFD